MVDEKHAEPAPPKPDVVEQLIPPYGPGVVDPSGSGPMDCEDAEIKMALDKSMQEQEERDREYQAKLSDLKRKHDAEEKAKRTEAHLKLAQMANEKAQRDLGAPDTPSRRKVLGVTLPPFFQG